MIIVFMKTRGGFQDGLAAVALQLLMVGCAAAGSGAADSTRPGVLQIVAAAYPFQFIAERVAGAHAVVSNLTQPGAEPHDLELGPRQVASITSADFVIYERGFQPVVDEAVAQSENPDVLDTTTVVPLRVHDRQDESDEGHTHQGAESGPILMYGSTRFRWQRSPTRSLIGWPPSTPPARRTIKRMSPGSTDS